MKSGISQDALRKMIESLHRDLRTIDLIIDESEGLIPGVDLMIARRTEIENKIESIESTLRIIG